MGAWERQRSVRPVVVGVDGHLGVRANEVRTETCTPWWNDSVPMAGYVCNRRRAGGALFGGWVADGAVWAVGETKEGNHVRPLVERLCGQSIPE